MKLVIHWGKRKSMVAITVQVESKWDELHHYAHIFSKWHCDGVFYGRVQNPGLNAPSSLSFTQHEAEQREHANMLMSASHHLLEAWVFKTHTPLFSLPMHFWHLLTFSLTALSNCMDSCNLPNQRWFIASVVALARAKFEADLEGTRPAFASFLLAAKSRSLIW